MSEQSLQAMVQNVLESHPHGISEYDLLIAVRSHSDFALTTKSDGTLQLFQQHFILMHALYSLQDALPGSELQLYIEPLNIRLVNNGGPNASRIVEQPPQANSLKDYYLDWNNYRATDAEEVQRLLQQFWRDYHRYFNRDDALRVLDLPADASLDTITARYRELAARHHPDRGGDPEQFIQVRAAYETLRRRQ